MRYKKGRRVPACKVPFLCMRIHQLYQQSRRTKVQATIIAYNMHTILPGMYSCNSYPAYFRMYYHTCMCTVPVFTYFYMHYFFCYPHIYVTPLQLCSPGKVRTLRIRIRAGYLSCTALYVTR